MSGQMEWWIMFVSGVAGAYLTGRIIGILPLLVLATAIPLCGFSAGTGVLIIHNDCGQSAVYQVWGDAGVISEYNNTYRTPEGVAFYPANDLNNGTADTIITANESDDFSGTPSLSGKLMITMYPDISDAGVGGAQTFVSDAPSVTNSISFTIGTDGHFYLTPYFSSGGGSVAPSTNAPWVPMGTNDAMIQLSNSYGGITWSVGYDTNNPITANARDAAAFSEIVSAAQSFGNMISAEATNEWNNENVLWTNATQSDAGSRDAEFNPWNYGPAGGYVNAGLMSNSIGMNCDPHNWDQYYRCSNFSLTAWTWILVISCVYMVREWIEDATDGAFMVPPEKSLSSVGGFIQGIVTASWFAGIIIALPIALDAVVSHFISLQPSTAIITLFTDDSTFFGKCMRYGWFLCNEWVPMDLIINAFFYMLLIRWQLMRAIKGANYLIIRLTT